MRNLIIIVTVVCIGCAIAGTSDTVDPGTITVKSTVTYNYEAKLPNGSVKEITSATVMTEKDVKAQAAMAFQAEIDKAKEIETKVAALDWKKCKIGYKEWVMYGKVIAYRYRYQLPDGSSNWIDSKVPLKDEDCLKVIQNSYRANLQERDGI